MLNAVCDITFSVSCYISESKCNSKSKKVAGRKNYLWAKKTEKLCYKIKKDMEEFPWIDSNLI